MQLSVTDFKALPCQITKRFIKFRNDETRTVSAIEAIRCNALAVLV